MMIKLLIGKRTVAIVSTCAPKQGVTEDRKYKSSKIWPPLSQMLEKMSWSYLVVTSTAILGGMQMVMMESIEVLCIVSKI